MGSLANTVDGDAYPDIQKIGDLEAGDVVIVKSKKSAGVWTSGYAFDVEIIESGLNRRHGSIIVAPGTTENGCPPSG